MYSNDFGQIVVGAELLLINHRQSPSNWIAFFELIKMLDLYQHESIPKLLASFLLLQTEVNSLLSVQFFTGCLSQKLLGVHELSGCIMMCNEQIIIVDISYQDGKTSQPLHCFSSRFCAI